MGYPNNGYKKSIVISDIVMTLMMNRNLFRTHIQPRCEKLAKRIINGAYNRTSAIIMFRPVVIQGIKEYNQVYEGQLNPTFSEINKISTHLLFNLYPYIKGLSQKIKFAAGLNSSIKGVADMETRCIPLNDRWVVEWEDTRGEIRTTIVKESRVPNYIRPRNLNGSFGKWLADHIKKSSKRAQGRIIILAIRRE